jgi:hypothetical protein
LECVFIMIICQNHLNTVLHIKGITWSRLIHHISNWLYIHRGWQNQYLVQDPQNIITICKVLLLRSLSEKHRKNFWIIVLAHICIVLLYIQKFIIYFFNYRTCTPILKLLILLPPLEISERSSNSSYHNTDKAIDGIIDLAELRRVMFFFITYLNSSENRQIKDSQESNEYEMLVKLRYIIKKNMTRLKTGS